MKQENLSVKKYINQFELSRFGMYLVNTPHKKAMKFVKGLNQPLQGLLLIHVPMGATYESLVEMTLMSDIVKEGESKEEVKSEVSKKKWWKKNKKKKKCDGPQK